jgi:hypothetical protein
MSSGISTRVSVMQDVLTEYLYCDKQRLDSYFEQISNPVAYDKVPIWKAALGITGPSVEGTQSRPGRPFTLHEKVQKIVSHLRANKFLDPGRAAPSSKASFLVEAMSAQRAAIPPNKEVTGFPGLNVWVSVESDTDARQRGELNTQKNSGALFFLEDFHKCDDDEPPMHFSSYSWLALLADVLGDGKPIALMNNSPQRAILVDALDSEFAIDPINALSRLGAMFGPERRVTALYRVRAMCMERWEDGGLQEGKKRPSDFFTTTIGYPLIITAEGGLLDGLI